MRTGSFAYLLREGVRNIAQNRLMSLATVGTLLSCLLLIGCSVLLTANINALVGYVESQNELMVFISDDITEDEIAGLEGDIRAIPGVSQVTFVSREEGLRRWVDTLNQTREFYAFLEGDNPMPNAFEVRVRGVDDFDVALMHLEGLPGVDRVRAPVEVAEAMSGLKQAFTVIALGVIIILAGVSLVIVANTIRLTVFARRREISIMRYVGATGMFIRLPFLFEGVLLGLFSGLLAFLFIWGGYSALAAYMPSADASWISLFANNLVPFKELAMGLLGGFLAAGAGIGTLGSMLFIGKHIKL